MSNNKSASRQVAWMSLFATIQASVFFSLKQQCHANFKSFRNAKKGAAFRRLEKVTRCAEWHHFILISLYVFSCVKYIPMILVRLNMFEQFYGWDCFLVGRFTFIGRSSKVSPYLAVALYGMFIFYRTQMAYFKPGGPFRFYALEFLLYNYDDLIEDELQVERRTFAQEDQQRWPARDVKLHFNYKYIDTRPQGPSRRRFDRFLYLENPFPMGKNDQFILRPNRTANSWLVMAKFTKISFYLGIFGTIGWLLLVYMLLAGHWLTRMGFELNYCSCVAWLRQQQHQSHNPDYLSSIHRTNKTLAYEIEIDKLPFFVPLSDFVELSLYSVVRIFFDLLENHLWYLDFWLFFMAFSYNNFLTCIDLTINVHEIKKKLTELISQMRDKTRNLNKTEAISANILTGSYHLEREVCRIQAIILDHLVMVRGYNSYMSFHLFLCVYVWFQHTSIVCIWMGMSKSKAVELEFAVAEMVTFVILLSLLSGPAIFRSLSNDLHGLICDAMALDDQVTMSKRRWTLIIQYFYPRSSHCFTMFDSIELSWLFCLKVSLSDHFEKKPKSGPLKSAKLTR